MILFMILTLILLLLTAFVVLAVGIGGSAFIIVFGDVIVCIVIVGWMIKKMFFRKRK